MTGRKAGTLFKQEKNFELYGLFVFVFVLSLII